jgi:hypothetical protein
MKRICPNLSMATLRSLTMGTFAVLVVQGDVGEPRQRAANPESEPASHGPGQVRL